MRIGEVAEETGLSITNIRFYERKKLLNPKRSEDSQYRDYTEDDVLRLKKIIVYRKMGMTIDTIYLILNEKIDWHDAVKMQEENIENEIENLKGSLLLCKRLIGSGCGDLDQNLIEECLEGVAEDERNGIRFAEMPELLEDITEYTIGVLPDEPYLWIYKNSWQAWVVSIAFWIMVLACPIIHLYDVARGESKLSLQYIVIFGGLIIFYLIGFFRYRNNRKANDR